MNKSELDKLPAATPPPGVKSNFDHPWSVAPTGIIVISAIMPLMVLVIASRIYARVRVHRSIGADDYFCFAAAASTITYSSICLWEFSDGYMGPRPWDVRVVDIKVEFIRSVIVTACLYSVSAMFLKASLLVSYLRFFRLYRSAHVLIWLGVVVIVVFYLTCIIITSAICNTNKWPKTPDLLVQLKTPRTCSGAEAKVDISQGIFSVLSDIYVILIPVLYLSKLKMAARRKMGLMLVFLVGLLATGCAVGTTYFRFLQDLEGQDADLSYILTLQEVLGAVELNVGVICSCAPATLILYKRGLQKGWWARLVSCTKARHTRQNRPPIKRANPNPNPARRRYRLPTIRLDLPLTLSGGMTSLRTWVRGSRVASSDSKDLFDEGTELSTTYSSCEETESVRKEYHRQLREVDSPRTPPRVLHHQRPPYQGFPEHQSVPVSRAYDTHGKVENRTTP